ncbi:hypothetical protein HK098_002110 [Nowakowskiella sp. JEL0407]|nr:hypothetical protein HK098_002110 [Nowakowskiella sp. JEL0407]
MKIVIEHMEEGCMAGPSNLYLTGMSPEFLANIPSTLTGVRCTSRTLEELLGLPRSKEISKQSSEHVDVNMDTVKFELSNVALLDPSSKVPLDIEDGSKFEYLLFGVILVVMNRTGMLRILGFVTRHLGPVQMTTDTAVHVTKKSW